MSKTPFSLKIKIGEMEVEIGGEKLEVLSTLDDLDDIVQKVTLAFNPDTKKTETKAVQIEPTIIDNKYPKIRRTTQCGEAVVLLLSTEWGKTPRTISELREAMEANAIFFPKTTLSGVLVWLTKKGSVRRWRDKKRGYLYVVNKQDTD
jgi:hypothetical protein